MAAPVPIAHDVASLRAQLSAWRAAGETIVLVPTMGALHAGHVSLVHAGKSHGTKIVMSIFVNPTQFAPTEDLSTYPRSLEADVAKFTEAGGDLVFVPSVDVMYPQGFATTISLAGPATVGLEDRFRPTHFAGVATVVAKLFNQCRPDAAVFGEKDYQQLKVLTCLARDLDFETKIVAAPIMREADGLALSSRNVYLSAEERLHAPALYRALTKCAEAIKTRQPVEAALEEARIAIAGAGFAIDYVEARHAETLASLDQLAGAPVRLLAAARIGKTRLIDNIAV
ncbi:pantoate--beta-alanine ligase [Methyloferula stellata]|uniref:pantoate--beta-alanine ligase n=1 Tax=Methyloferula stellata TaxID=876270 RepID=UPI000362B69F|nr:pantoate--beta-alanine ligase [Methyloferula stellata]